MGRKEKLKIARRAEEAQREIIKKENKKKGRIFALLLLLLAVAAYEISIMLENNKQTNEENADIVMESEEVIPGSVEEITVEENAGQDEDGPEDSANQVSDIE